MSTTSNEIRKRFLDFFAARGHHVVRSSSLVPAQDATLLFANAGMNQFKDVFLGREKRDYVRACSSQKCVRAGGKHNDLEQVGRTTRHHTFFEMLGNFSFGDYFKKQAIPWAWELITKDFAIPAEKLYVTIFEGATIPHADIPRDTEAYDYWRAVGVSADRIFELGMKENFWQMGETGPCGPCSEIHYDLGPVASEQGHTDCKFPCDCGRYVEIWNLVFMQYDRSAGVKDGVPWYEFSLLPQPCVDTGAGLERLAALLQGKLSNFETDLFKPLIEESAGLANVEYGANHDTDVSLRIIADHARAATFLISDGVVPSNEGRGYVLRLILRRALYHGQTLGLNEPFMFKLSGHVVDLMKDAYPELAATAHHVAKTIKIEEERYAHTTAVALERLDEKKVHFVMGGKVFEMAFGDWRRNASTGKRLSSTEAKMLAGLSQQAPFHGTDVAWLSGEDAFELHDTFGLRPDFVADLVRDSKLRIEDLEYQLVLDRHSYDQRMSEQRERARSNWKGQLGTTFKPVYGEAWKVYQELPEDFSPERTPLTRDAKIVTMIRDDQLVQSVPAGVKAEVFLDSTPLYAESGGQVGDAGDLRATTGESVLAHVDDAKMVLLHLTSHFVRTLEPLEVGMPVRAMVDAPRRAAIRRNHTATHLLHAALRTTLGTHVKQAGSLVAPDRLRFDFTHHAALDKQDLLDIEDLVNERILSNDEVHTQVMEIEAAIASGAMALFDEKYGSQVRVVSVDGFSKELCGGTHVRRTGDIGAFKIISEGSVAAGIRRIEALTGEGVLKHLREASETLALLSQTLRVKPDELLAAVEKLTEGEKKLRKELEAFQMKRAAAQAGDLAQTALDVKGVRVVAARVEAMDRNALRQMVDELRPKLGSGVIFLGTVVDGKVALIAAVTKDLTNRLDAGKIVKAAAVLVEGSGGGRKDLAEAGGKRPDKLDESLRAVPSIVEKML